MTGDVTMDRDFVVEACQIAPPGDGLLSGYHMNAKDGDPAIPMLAIVLKDYAKDGVFSPADKSAEGQVNAGMSTGVMGPLTLIVTKPNSPMPVGVMMKPESTLEITISQNGQKGVAAFSKMESPPSFEDIDLKSNAPPHGKVLSGEITWTCGKIDQIDPQMNKAVNGMFDGLKKQMTSH